MQTIDGTITTQLADGLTIVRGLIKFEFGTGTYGFARSAVPITYDGLVYEPGNLIQVSDLPYAPGTSAQEFSVSLAVSGDDDLVDAALQSIYSEDYQDRPVTIMDAHFNTTTGALIEVVTLRKGYLDILREEFSEDGGLMLVADCLSRSLDYSRINGRLSTDLDQQRRSASDRFFEHASKSGRVDLYWGRKRPKK